MKAKFAFFCLFLLLVFIVMDAKKLNPICLGCLFAKEKVVGLQGLVGCLGFAEELERIMKMIISLNELDNSDNLEVGKPSNTLFTYFVTSSERYTLFESQSPQYKKLKNDTITSLTLAITDQNNDIITDGAEVTVVLHIR